MEIKFNPIKQVIKEEESKSISIDSDIETKQHNFDKSPMFQPT